MGTDKKMAIIIKCEKLCDSIVKILKKKYPRLRFSMRRKIVTLFLGHDEKLLSPYKRKIIVENRYNRYYNDLSTFDYDKFEQRIINK